MTEFTLTPEQADILSAATNTNHSLMVDALAGSGKTSTLVLLANALPQGRMGGQMLLLAFNKKIQMELTKRMPPMVTVLTMNSLGHRAWAKLLSGRPVKLEERKLGNLVSAYMKQNDIKDETGDLWQNIRKLVDGARNAGLVPLGTYPTSTRSFIQPTMDGWEQVADRFDLDFSPELVGMAETVLARSITLAYQGEIDFGDQIYMSACFGAQFPRYPLVMIDEAQDLSPLNHEMVARTASGRIIAVGDPNQSIYAFRGADMASMEILQTRNSMVRLPLSVSFRCPKAVIRNVNKIVPQIRHTDWAEEGSVTTKRYWDESDLPHVCAVICRNNAPLMALAFKLIKRRRGVNFLGTDIVKGLTALVKKLDGGNSIPISAFVEKLHDWKRKEIDAAEAKDKKELISRVHDKHDCLMAVIEGDDVSASGQIQAVLDSLFSMQHGGVILGTGHKFKGLEEDHVLFLDPWRIPSKYARQAKEDGNYGPMQQEMNLKYVIETRAKKTLTYVNLDGFEADDEKEIEETKLPRFLTHSVEDAASPADETVLFDLTLEYLGLDLEDKS